MKTRNILITTIALGLLAIAAVSFAGMHGGGMGYGNCGNGGGMGYGHGHGQGMMTNCPGGGMGYNLTPEQQEKFTALQDAYYKKTETLRTDMWAKHTELEALSGNDKVDPKYITQLVQDMKDIGTKLRAEREAFEAQVEKEIGIKNFRRGQGRNPNCPYADGTAPAAPAAPAN
ncbi:periplasmic heavy metal sensor [Desulfovibrio mangrovi]|uniref:Spy/CpxP family protein refolding chaperone n=1 Tax=Desulfovibrio mangrovi TaxID=2976983 RepID=UPI002246F65B|nr:periplasmic heavy metal sensor [Desulfovibrio mangrovi]UZP66355.1 periplasmic heavy metal sensor [Desulfovibrio mangrovi]